MLHFDDLEVGMKIKSKVTGNIGKIVELECRSDPFIEKIVWFELEKRGIDEFREIGRRLRIGIENIIILENENEKYFLKKYKKEGIA